MNIYADTSFFVSLYLTDLHTQEAEHRLAARPFLWMTLLHVAEWTHAIEQHVFRKVITRDQANGLHQQFQKHRNQGLWREAALPDQASDLCIKLCQQHGAGLGVRTLDTLHVASALELKSERFWTFDQRQAKLAQAAGLKIN
ncbi:MAG: type II toxin-antitoxin system VapC family toxin [Terriglobales bacterium]